VKLPHDCNKFLSVREYGILTIFSVIKLAPILKKKKWKLVLKVEMECTLTHLMEIL